MYELFMGLVMTVLTAWIIYETAKSGGLTLTPMMLLGLFLFLGLGLIFTSIKKMIADKKTNAYGEYRYGMVVRVFPSGAKDDKADIMNAEIIVVQSGGVIGVYVESMRTNHNKYRVGQYVYVKHYGNDINIISKIEADGVPKDVRDKIAASVVIDGVEYVNDPMNNSYYNNTDNDNDNYNNYSDYIDYYNYKGH